MIRTVLDFRILKFGINDKVNLVYLNNGSK